MIAKRLGVSIDELYHLNEGKNLQILNAGTEIVYNEPGCIEESSDVIHYMEDKLFDKSPLQQMGSVIFCLGFILNQTTFLCLNNLYYGSYGTFIDPTGYFNETGFSSFSHQYSNTGNQNLYVLAMFKLSENKPHYCVLDSNLELIYNPSQNINVAGATINTMFAFYPDSFFNPPVF